MAQRDENEAWREIVENYGDSPTWEEDAAPGREEPETGPIPRSVDDPDAWHPAEHEERFVPPTPPPVPIAEPKRLVAWSGLFLAPFLLLVALVLGWNLPGLVTTLLLGWFVGGFLYLVSQMPHGPRDPGDDGAQI